MSGPHAVGSIVKAAIGLVCIIIESLYVFVQVFVSVTLNVKL